MKNSIECLTDITTPIETFISTYNEWLIENSENIKNISNQFFSFVSHYFIYEVREHFSLDQRKIVSGLYNEEPLLYAQFGEWWIAFNDKFIVQILSDEVVKENRTKMEDIFKSITKLELKPLRKNKRISSLAKKLANFSIKQCLSLDDSEVLKL